MVLLNAKSNLQPLYHESIGYTLEKIKGYVKITMQGEIDGFTMGVFLKTAFLSSEGI